MKEALIIDQSCEEEKILKIMRQHYFNQSVKIITTTDKAPKLDYFWYEVHANLLFFLNEKTLHSKETVALSISRLDTEDVFCFANGILTMNVTKQSYYEVGIQGKKSKLVQGRFDPAFKKGSKLYNRVEWCFSNTCTVKHKFYVSVVDAKGQHQLHAFPVELSPNLCKPSVVCNEINDTVYYPDFNLGKHDKQFLNECYEWIGLANLQSPRILVSDTVDPFIAIYSPPEPNFKVPKLKLFEIRGFFAPAVIESLHRAKYEVFSVSGVEHAPIGFDNHENTYLNGGENDYSVVRTDKQNILFQAIKFFS